MNETEHPVTGRLTGVKVCMLVTNDVSRDARVRKEASSLTKAGAHVTVVGVGTGSTNGSRGLPCEVDLVPPPRASLHSNRYVRIARNLIAEHDFEARMEDAAVRCAADVVHSHDLDTLLPGARAARRSDAALVYDSHELYVEQAGIKPWRGWLLRRRERRLIRSARVVMTVNRHIARELASRYSVPRVDVVYNGASSCVAQAAPVHAPVRLLFQGALAEDRNLEELLWAMTVLRGRAVLTFQGFGGIEERLVALAHELDLDDVVRFLPPCPPEAVVSEAAQHDVGIINHKATSLNNLYSSPNKLFDYMAAGLAIAATDLPVLRYVIADAGNGVLFEQEGWQGTARVLQGMVQDTERLHRMKMNAVAACPRYSWSAQEAVLVRAYERALGRRPAA